MVIYKLKKPAIRNVVFNSITDIDVADVWSVNGKVNFNEKVTSFLKKRLEETIVSY